MEDTSASTNAAAVAAKKRKLSIAGNSSLTGIQFEVKEFENQKLKEFIEKVETEKQLLMDENHQLKAKLAKTEGVIKDLQAKNEETKDKIDLMKSIIANNEAKVKAIEEEKQKLEEKVKELEDANSTIKTIKIEIKDNAESDIDKLKSEIAELNEKNQKLLDDHQKDTAYWKQQQDAAKLAIRCLENKLASSKKVVPKKRKTKTKSSASSKSALDAVVKPPKAIEKAPILTAEEQSAADDETNASNLSKGARVFARWGKEYFSAVIAGSIDGRYKVFYTEDQLTRNVPNDGGIIPIWLIKEGSKVSVVGEKDEDGEKIVYDGKVLTTPDINNIEEWYHGIYMIEIWNDEHPETEIREIIWSDIYFTDEQYKEIIKTAKNTANLDNVLESRRRKTRRFVAAGSVSTGASLLSLVTPSSILKASSSNPCLIPSSTISATASSSTASSSPAVIQGTSAPGPNPIDKVKIKEEVFSTSSDSNSDSDSS